MSRGAQLGGITAFNPAITLIVSCCLAAFFSGDARAQASSNPGLTVRFFGAGHADSILLRTRDGHTILVDAGIGRWKWGDHLVRRRLLPYFKKEGIRRLDAFIVTHPHFDHVGDPMTLRQNVFFSGIFTNADGTFYFRRFRRALEQAAGQRVPVWTLWRGDWLRYDRLKLDVLHPHRKGPPPWKVKRISTQNQRSLVIRATYGRIRFLLTGDIGNRTRREILRSGLDVRADVLKLGHHGLGPILVSWIRAVRPRYAVATCCGSGAHRPLKSLFSCLRRNRIRFLDTHKIRDIEFTTDGSKLDVREYLDHAMVLRYQRRARWASLIRKLKTRCLPGPGRAGCVSPIRRWKPVRWRSRKLKPL